MVDFSLSLLSLLSNKDVQRRLNMASETFNDGDQRRLDRLILIINSNKNKIFEPLTIQV